MTSLQELQHQLNLMEEEGRCNRLDSRMTIRKELSAISKETFKMPYYLSIIKLNNGIMPGYPKLTQKEIAALFQDKAKEHEYNHKMISSDIRKAIQHFEIRDILNSINAERLPEVEIKYPHKNNLGKISKCVFCQKEYRVAKDCLAACRKCLGIREPSNKHVSCLKCGKSFKQTHTNWRVCSDCNQFNKANVNDERYSLPQM